MEKEADRITATGSGGGYDAVFCIRGEGEVGGWRGGGGRGRVRTSSDVAAVMKRERNDWRQEVEGEGR